MLTHDEWKKNTAEWALLAKTATTLDATYAAAAAKARAANVRVDDGGNVDEGTLTVQFSAIMQEAPAKMRHDYDASRRNDAETYAELRRAVAEHYAAKSVGGAAELSRRLGS